MSRPVPDLKVGHASSEFEFWRGFLSGAESDRLFAHLRDHSPWVEQSIKIYGRDVAMPRLTCWYGDQGAAYRYSGLTNTPHPWSSELQKLRGTLQEFTGSAFNSVLLNYYRSGDDSLAWHSDDESELGETPTIASISLGGARRFDVKEAVGNVRFQLMLAPGSLLLMKGEAQKAWRHAVPKSKAADPRINLTFRKVLGVSPQRDLI